MYLGGPWYIEVLWSPCLRHKWNVLSDESQKPTACSARGFFLFEQEEFYITDDGQSVRKTDDSVIEEFEM